MNLCWMHAIPLNDRYVQLRARGVPEPMPITLTDTLTVWGFAKKDSLQLKSTAKGLFDKGCTPDELASGRSVYPHLKSFSAASDDSVGNFASRSQATKFGIIFAKRNILQFILIAQCSF